MDSRVAARPPGDRPRPDDNRARSRSWRPGPDLVVLPEAFARDFGEAGSDVSPYAEPVDGPFAREVARVAERPGTTVVAGMFEKSPTRTGPSTPSSPRGPAQATYRKIHLYDSFGYRESDRLTGGPVEPVVVDVGGFRSG